MTLRTTHSARLTSPFEFRASLVLLCIIAFIAANYSTFYKYHHSHKFALAMAEYEAADAMLETPLIAGVEASDGGGGQKTIKKVGTLERRRTTLSEEWLNIRISAQLCWVQAFSVFLTYTTSLFLFPGFISEIPTPISGWNIDPTLLPILLIVECFLQLPFMINEVLSIVRC